MSDCSERMVRLGKDVVVPDGYEVDEIRCVKFGEEHIGKDGCALTWDWEFPSTLPTMVLRKLPSEFKAGEVVRRRDGMGTCYVVTEDGKLVFVGAERCGDYFADRIARGKYILANDEDLADAIRTGSCFPLAVVRILLMKVYGK